MRILLKTGKEIEVTQLEFGKCPRCKQPVVIATEKGKKYAYDNEQSRYTLHRFKCNKIKNIPGHYFNSMKKAYSHRVENILDTPSSS